MPKTIAGIFESAEQARQAAERVKNNGLRTNDISIISKDAEANGRLQGEGFNDNGNSNTEDGRFVNTGGSTINDNMSGGAVTGGVLGGLAGLIIGMGTIVIPGLGVIAAAGPIAGLLSGALTGGIVGGLVDLGIPEAEGKEYEKEIHKGNILWTMSTDDKNAEQVANILRSAGATSVKVY
jgi:hypothetical protein